MNHRRDFRVGLGPVFACERVALSRRWQWYASRSLFAAMLLAALLTVLLKAGANRGPTTIRDLASLGQSFYIAVIGTQITLVLLAAPAATAGSICLDRASGTLTHLLVTDLSDAEIVLGKLASRLAPVLGLAACALPILAILTLLGGIVPEALLGGFLVTLGVAVLGCSLAFSFSLWAKRTHEALMATYAVWCLWLVARPLLDFGNRAFGLSLSAPPGVADPYHLAFAPYWYPNSVSFADDIRFLAVTSSISLALTMFCIWRLRPACTRVDLPKRRSLRGRLAAMGPAFDPARYLPGPPLDFNPVLWREWHRARPASWGRVIGGLFAVLAATASVGAILMPRVTYATAWVNGLQVSIGFLLLSVTAATSLAEERVRGSLDVLMATPLSTRAIVLGKWLGTFRLVPSLAVLPLVVVLLTNPLNPSLPLSALLMLAFMFIFGAAIAGLGLAMATWCASLGRAVALTVSCYLLVAVGWLFFCITLGNGPASEGAIMACPFMFAGWLTADLAQPNRQWDHFGWLFLWLIVYAVVAVGLLGATLLGFDRCLGRVEVGVAAQIRGASRARFEPREAAAQDITTPMR